MLLVACGIDAPRVIVAFLNLLLLAVERSIRYSFKRQLPAYLPRLPLFRTRVLSLMKKMKFLLAGAAALLSMTSVANAALINGGFEAPVAPGSDFLLFPATGNINGWDVVGVDLLLINSAYAEGALTFNASSGVQSLDLTGNGNTGFADGVTQSVDTVVNQLYSLSFFVGRADDTTSGSGFYTSQSTVDLSFDGGITRTSFTNADVTIDGVNWRQFTTTFVAAAPTTNIGFFNGTPSVANGGNNFAGLDGVRLQAIPEPASAAIIGVCVAAAGAASYRRRRYAAQV